MAPPVLLVTSNPMIGAQEVTINSDIARNSGSGGFFMARVVVEGGASQGNTARVP